MKVELNRANAPKPKETITFELPSIQHFTLSNGLKVLFVQKSNLPIVQLSLTADAGSKFDYEGKSGLAYLTAMMIDEGAGGLSSLELDNEIELLGSILSISTDHDSVHISTLTLMENFERTVELFSKIIREPHFTDEDFEREKKKLLTKVFQLRDEPSYIASNVFSKLVYKNSLYENPTIGTDETIKSIANEDVKNFHKELYGPNNSTLVVVGNIEAEKLINALEKYLRGWNKIKNPKAELNFSGPEGTNIYVVNKADAPQSEIRVGYLSGKRNPADFFPKLILNTILGGQFSSRINLNLREDKGYTYGAHSQFSYNKFSGKFIVSTSVNSQNTGDSVSEILKEIIKIKEGVSEAEYNFAKSFLIKRFPSLFETYSQIATNLTNLVIHNLPEDYYNKYIKSVNSTGIEEVNEASKNILRDSLSIVAVGNKEIIYDQLKNLNLGEITELDFNGDKIN